MPRGRKPKTADIVALEGYRGKRRPKAAKVAGIAGIPQAPAWLSARAAALWRHAVRWLGEDLGTLTPGDQTMVGLYCETAAEYENVTRRLRRTGRLMSVINPQGSKVYRSSPLVEQQNELRRQLRLLAAELGLSPVARARVPQASDDTASETETIGSFLGRKE